MANFLDKIFGSKIEVDLLKIELEAKLSFHESRIDSHLANMVSERLDAAEQQSFLCYLRDVAAISEGQHVAASQELGLLQRYIAFYQQVMGDALFLRFDCQAESDRLLPAFVLFPLIHNALVHGYNSMEKFPLKIKIRIFEKALQVDVTNHVNHHIASQEDNSLIDRFKSRLVSLFGEQHQLLFNSNSHTFKSNLHIPA
ncbi:LytS family sensor histidine kinase [Sphingobacterium bambusae]|uniref:Signal transduction histidine kinase internal region domain-containing protein n=1 Tax=Sphingobacterium bambusae TaxID=662858 RepID=A0ABW6BCF0_9SPHI|nr:hypothetical protein [Sphingobacterium bambusae]WPL49205.1 hypothetical protein SCB77_01830 [Sphingobacterium bambusae]